MDANAMDLETALTQLRTELSAEFDSRWPGLAHKVAMKGECWVFVPDSAAELEAIRGRLARRSADEKQTLARSCGDDLCVVLAHIGPVYDHVTPPEVNTKVVGLVDDLLLSDSPGPISPLDIALAEGFCRGCAGARAAVLHQVLGILTDSPALKGRIVEDWVWELAGANFPEEE